MNRRYVLALLAVAGGLMAAPAAKQLTPEELSKLLEKRENIFFLDVRQPSEIAQLGSVKGYVNIPLDQLEKRIGEVPHNKLIITL